MQHLLTSIGTIASATLLNMQCLRRAARIVAFLTSLVLMTAWVTGAHAHRHVGAQEHGHTGHTWGGVDSNHELGHSDELNVDDAIAADIPSSEHDEGDHSAPHLLSLIHLDGHDNIELQALQAPAVKLLLNLPLLLPVLLCFALLVLTRPHFVAVPTDPSNAKRADWFLSPPLRGPPAYSVA